MTMSSKLQLKRWGNSLAVRIPSALAQQVHFAEDQEVEFRVEGSRLVLSAADDLFSWDRYNEQLNAMTQPTEETSIDFGNPVGNEWNID